MPTEANAQASYFHPKNISIGHGRVLYAGACTDTGGRAHAEGWVLPGGRRTQSQVEAHGGAMQLNALIGGTP